MPPLSLEVIVKEKSAERLAMEKEASVLGIQGNIPAFKDETLSKKIAEVKEQKAVPKDNTPVVSKPVPEDGKIIVGKNACKGKFGIAGKVFGPGEDVILTKADMENRNVNARVVHAKKCGMIK